MRKALWAAVVIAGLTAAANAAPPATQQDGRVVTAVDRSNRSFVALSYTDGSTNNYKTTDRTVFRVGSTPTSWAAVKAGSKVVIVYHLEGQGPVADEVVISD